MYLKLLFTSLSFVLVNSEDLVLLAKTHTTPLSKYVHYIDSVILHFHVPLDTSFACFKFEAEEIQLSLFRCQPQDITVYLKQGSPPVINPDKSKIPKSFFNFSRPMEKLEFKSSGEPGYINVTSPIGGSYFASAFISYTDPNFQAITQQGLTPNCDTVITTTLFVNRALKPIMAVPDMDTDVLLESNTAKVYKFHVFDVIDDTILFLNNIDFCDDCTELDVHVQSNRIPLNEFLYSANLKKTDYDNKSYMFRIMTAEDSWYYVSFNMHAKNGTKARSHFEFKFTYFYLPNNDHEEFINVSKNGTGIGNVKFKRATLRDYQSQRIDHPVMYKQYDLMRSSHTESFLYSFDLSSDDDVLPVPVNITNEDMVILKFHVTPGVDIGGTLQFGLAFKPRIRKDGKNVKIIEEPKNHTLIGCLKNNAKEIPTWPNKCSLLGEQSNAAVILNGTVKNGTILVPFPESGNWYASLKLFCGECKPCKCPEMCKKQYRTCYTKCETSCTSIKNCSSCVEGCEQLIISKRGCETCDCDGPCQKSKVFCNSSILFEVSSYPCINGQCGVNGKCMYMVTEGFSYSVCFCMNKYKGWDCSDDSAAKSKGMIILELLLLVLSNLAFLPAVYVAYRRHYYVEAVVYFSTFFFSSFYHACDAGENIYTFCMVRISVLQFSDFFCGLLSIWVTILAIAHLPKRFSSVLHIGGAIILAFITTINRTALWAFGVPFGTSTAILILSWFYQYKKTGKRFPSNYYLFRCFPAGLSIVAIGLLIYGLLQTNSNYMYLHSFWHICMAISIIFLLPGKSFLPSQVCDLSQNEHITQ